VERIVALRVYGGQICIVGDEKSDDVEITIASSPLDWSSNEDSARSVNFSTLLDQIATGCYMGVDSCPMKWCDVLTLEEWPFQTQLVLCRASCRCRSLHAAACLVLTRKL
jgi:hypothetical protein